MNPEHASLLRRLALNDEATTEALLGVAPGPTGASSLDARTFALVRVAALIAVDSPQASVQWAVDSALAVGAQDEDVVEVLAAVAPIVGLARVMSAAPDLALALGCDVNRADTG